MNYCLIFTLDCLFSSFQTPILSSGTRNLGSQVEEYQKYDQAGWIWTQGHCWWRSVVKTRKAQHSNFQLSIFLIVVLWSFGFKHFPHDIRHHYVDWFKPHLWGQLNLLLGAMARIPESSRASRTSIPRPSRQGSSPTFQWGAKELSLLRVFQPHDSLEIYWDILEWFKFDL